MIDELELAIAYVVVDGLGDADGRRVQAALVGQVGDLVGSVHRVVAADIEEVADVVGAQDLDDPFKILGLLGP